MLLLRKICISVRSSPLILYFKNNWNGESKKNGYKIYYCRQREIIPKKKNLTQMELAEKTELSLDSIKRIEGGRCGLSLDSFLRVSDVLHVPLSYLLCERKEEIPEERIVKEIISGKNDNQKKYLLHMLYEMAKEMDRLL